MNDQQAHDIINSPAMIQVTYRGIPIYLKHINDDGTATVFPLDEINNEQRVELNGLSEKGPFNSIH
ncbi:H-type small acid-soluble spore protein [Lentibacillus saliphilus]|uniref:H-type small acid-soluble spore protein n=1 Tax=Lentibacillus saliphilus TaxID=2737028 RepID=UPI001C307AC1|nr:H-type small acid-soluble spore protein [Lentibacillus saliphilus]